ncbi:MAG TPA: beta-galactosidase, partial [Bryobacteraceae bacterium]
MPLITRRSALLALGSQACLLSVLAAAPGRVLVIEDFENAAAPANWDGTLRIATQHVSHGRSSALVRFAGRDTQLSLKKLPGDWRGYERLLLDVYNERKDILTATLRIYDEAGEASKARRDYYEADGQVLLIPGWNHVEVKLAGIHAASYERDLALDRIRRITFSIDRGALPCTLYIDNLRLVAGVEPPEMASRTQPQDAVTLLWDRYFQVRQVAAPERVPESAEVKRLRKEAQAEAELLDKTIKTAQVQGIETIYAERRVVTAELGLRVRPRLAWFNNDAAKREMFDYVARSCRQSRVELENKIDGSVQLPFTDDTQVGDPLIRPFPPLKGRPVRDWFFRDERGEPMIVVSLHSPSRLLERFFATPKQHIESYSVGGGSRWSIEDSPVYTAFREDQDTHRVGWDGWCGHLVRDLDSMGTSKPENTVICLESPRIRRALQEYIRINIPKFHSNPELLYNILAYELMYICYCERSQAAFREWLTAKHGTIAEANRKWGTAYKQFSEVAAPPVKSARPLPGTNRGLWYDWARFNQDRFTSHLLWVRNEVRKLDPSVPLAAGGSSSMLSGITGTTGIDEERIVNEVDDVIIHEGGGSTMGMDLQLALSENRKPLADPEMNLGSVHALLPHVLHGKSVIQIWHWPAQPGAEFHSNNQTSLAHGWQYGLADVDELLRVALDVRRLNKEVSAFVDAPAEAAILYSQTSTLQLPPEMLGWETTPYLAELRKTYEASQCLDTRVTFITERQILKGWLSRYRILLVPAARNLPAGVAAKIWDYAAQGGRVVVLPESLLGDEYNRPAAYLERLGIRILDTQRPKPGLSGGMAQGYDQSFSEQVTFADAAPLVLKPATGASASLGELTARGVRQNVSTGNGAEVLFRFPDGKPAILRVALGRGAAYYSAAALDEPGYARLLESLFTEAGVHRPVRVRSLDGPVEARFVAAGNRKLLYVVNWNERPARLRVE